MCGIVGYFSTLSLKEPELIINKMMNAINHRGPNANDFRIIKSKEENEFAIGHVMSDIRDLSENITQPMESISNKSIIAFNGKIFNYKELRNNLKGMGIRFKTSSETEVVLNMYEKYGIDCLEQFKGMFSLVIYDSEKESFFIARDRLGIKPLYYTSHQKKFIFSSEVKSIFKFPSLKANLNNEKLSQYLQNRYVNNPETLFENIKKVEPGQYIIVNYQGIKKEIYWEIKTFDKFKNCTSEKIEEIVENKLLESVQLCMTNDVATGAFLSGGLDSSLIVAMMAKCSSYPIKTFSVGVKEKEYSELPNSKKVAKIFGTQHTEIMISPQDIMDNIYSAIWHRDFPVGEFSDIPIQLLGREAKKQVGVILTGDGCDELFGGYPKHAYDFLGRSRLYKFIFKNKLVENKVFSLPYDYRRIKHAYNVFGSNTNFKRMNNWFATFTDNRLNKVLSEEFKHSKSSEVSKSNVLIKGHTNLDKMFYFDLKYWIPDNILERGDKMTMSVPIENRFPFLEHNLVETAFRLKDNERIKILNRKSIIKKIALKYLPSEIVNQKKKGFYLPMGSWFRGSMKDFLLEHLQSSLFRQRGYFNIDYIEYMIDNHMRGIINYEKELWTLLNLEIWFRTYID